MNNMKKFFSLVLFTILGCTIGYAQRLNDVTLENPSTGETYDFYSSQNNTVIYHANGSPVSRRGEFSIGAEDRNVAHAVGETRKYITINIYVGERTVTLRGIISYQSSGKVNYIKLDNGSTLKPW